MKAWIIRRKNDGKYLNADLCYYADRGEFHLRKPDLSDINNDEELVEVTIEKNR